ncbi:TRAP transporter substrate-binding protein [uncultured Deefgea sp.]|uniref:TRAP transporter substrate-binding protein n=1 Tax=uncultured Deefgea sp. TaxID=1304914 RepID=UPI002595B7DD|nr:TRAP transporter substrate-binding protein [uncultured Deefgea sp.]
MKKTLLSKMIASAVILGFVAAPAMSAVRMKLSHNQSVQHPVHISMKYFADRAKVLSNGDVQIRIYPDGSLGDQKDSLEQVQNGAIALAKSNASELESFHKPYSVFNYPYIFNDSNHFYKVLFSPIGKDILASSASKGFIGIAYYDGGARSFYAKKPIKSPADLKGMKIRVQPSKTAIEMLTVMGANPTPLSFGELYTSLQQGVVDGAENNPPSFTLNRHSEVAKFFSLDEHTMVPDVLVMSTKVWNKLSDANKKAILQAAEESTNKMRTLWAASEKDELEKAKKMGVSIVAVDKKPFQDAVKPIFDKLKVSDPATYEQIEKIRALGR